MRVHIRIGWPRAVVALLIAAGVAGYIALAPTSLGGSSRWITTSGISMEPDIEAGDLVITRPDSSYRTGDVIAYPSESLDGTVVLHRIIDDTSQRLVTQGDNNDWIDPDRPHSSEVLGEMWLHIPGGGRMLSAFDNTYLILGLVLAGLAAATTGAVLRARRKRPVSPAGARRRAGAEARGRDGFSPAALTEWATVAALVFAGVGLFGFTQPLTTSSQTAVEFRNTADLRYAAQVDAPDVYASDRLRTGDPVFLDLVPVVDTSLRYRLSAASSELSGTVGAVARITASNGWSHTEPIAAPTRFTGPDVRVNTALDLAVLREAAESAERAAGFSFGGYTVEVRYNIDVTGSIDGQPAETSYEPTMSFTLDSMQVILQDETTPGTDGEPVVRLSAAGELERPGTVHATLSLLGFDMPVAWIRILAPALALIAAALAIVSATQARRLRAAGLGSWGSRLVTASNVDPLGRAVIDLDDADSLSRIATRHDSAIIYVPHAEGDMYYVMAGDTIYRYTPSTRRRSTHASHGSNRNYAGLR